MEKKDVRELLIFGFGYFVGVGITTLSIFLVGLI